MLHRSFLMLSILIFSLNSGLSAEYILEPLPTKAEALIKLSDRIVQSGILIIENADYFIRLDDRFYSMENIVQSHNTFIDTGVRKAQILLSLGNLYHFLANSKNLPPSLISKYRSLAIDAYQKALQNGIQSDGLHEKLGLLYLEQDDRVRALHYLQAAWNSDRSNALLNYNLAYVLFLLERYQQALEPAEIASKLSQGSQLSYNSLLLYGEILLANQQLTQATSIFQNIRNIDQRNLYPQRRLMICYARQDNLTELELILKSYLTIMPIDIDNVSRLLNLFQEEGHAETALKQTREYRRRIIRTRPQAAAILAWLEASLLQSMGKNLDGLKIIEEALNALADTMNTEAIQELLENLQTSLTNSQTNP